MSVKIDDILIASKEIMVMGDFSKLYKFTDYHRIPYMEFHVADHCNLNCKGCVHFAPLVTQEVFSVFDKVNRDLTQLKSIVPYINTIRILGGEPLLNSELPNYLELTPNLYPFAEINIVTNGILLQNKNNILIDSLKKNKIGVNISVYPQCLKKLTRLFLKRVGKV